MKRIMIDIPDNTCMLSITYVYVDEALKKMCGIDLITYGDNPDVLRGEKAYNVSAEDRKEQVDEL